jgi:uncharacterized protein
MNTTVNPFVTFGYAGQEYFCDREEETKSILRSIVNNTPVTLTSIRRIGKTGLIRHVLSKLPRNYVGIYLDIQSAENLNDFMNILVTGMIQAVPEKSKPGKIIWNFIKSLRPTITFDQITGSPQITIDSKLRKVEPDIEAILNFLEGQPYRIVIAIDEFQQILRFPEKQTDAWLRSKIQQLNNLAFIFAGSQQQLMGELFSSPSRPFYRSTNLKQIHKLNAGVYRPFIVRLFRNGNRKISEDIADQILEWADGVTYYVQLLCNRVYSSGEKEITPSLWQSEAASLIKEAEPVFFSYRELLTHPQWMLLKAVAAENKVKSPTSREFMTKYQLNGSATVLQSLKALVTKELVYKDYDSDGQAFHSVHDLLFKHWVCNQ